MFQVNATRSRQKLVVEEHLGDRGRVAGGQRLLEALEPLVDLGGHGLYAGIRHGFLLPVTDVQLSPRSQGPFERAYRTADQYRSVPLRRYSRKTRN